MRASAIDTLVSVSNYCHLRRISISLRYSSFLSLPPHPPFSDTSIHCNPRRTAQDNAVFNVLTAVVVIVIEFVVVIFQGLLWELFGFRDPRKRFEYEEGCVGCSGIKEKDGIQDEGEEKFRHCPGQGRVKGKGPGRGRVWGQGDAIL